MNPPMLTHGRHGQGRYRLLSITQGLESLPLAAASAIIAILAPLIVLPAHAAHTAGYAAFPFPFETVRPAAADIHPVERGAETAADGAKSPVSASPATSTASPADLWDRIRNGFALAEFDSQEVRDSEDFYVSQPEYMQRIFQRSKRYLFHIVEEVERRGMPAEIALLPIIESAFNPVAYSPGHASGIWQLIPSTAKMLGLKQNWWYDGRRDIIAGTNAALNYLQKLYSIFGDWELVLASYNWGAGAVERSLNKNRSGGLPADFRNISLPPETQNYVPRLIAIKNIISNPAIFGIELEPVPNEPYFEEVVATRHMDVKLAAKLADISMDEFNALNPAHNRPVINTDGPRTLLFPVDKAEIFAANLQNHDKPLVSWQAYQAKKGETAELIAERCGISVRRLKEVNELEPNEMIAPGQILLVPRNGTIVGASISTMSNKPAKLKVFPDSFAYEVRNGDVLSHIAKRYGVTVGQIKSWNRMSTDRLSIGQKLMLRQNPGADAVPRTPEPIPILKKRM
ncbi:MAG TPA: LysM peptidoglycan-binding domain-containing protein [Nitrosospira sp.]|nr:LysM peptidoglycan-binding domain-containing protein [Nitrosospira sp.]